MSTNEKYSHLFESFAWRFYNTFKVTIFPVIAYVLLNELQARGDLSCLAEASTWGKVGYAVLVTLLSSTLAGTDKVLRERIRLEE